MNDEHDETTCPELHTSIDYSVRAYTVNAGALAFEAWFKTVFSVQNPTAARDFEFERKEFEGESVIELLAHNPSFFTVDVLEALWMASRYTVEDKSKASANESNLKFS